MASKASQTMKRASAIVGSGGLAVLVKDHGIGGLFYAFFEVAIAMVYSLGDTFLAPFMALYSGVAGFVDRTILAGLEIIDAGGQTSAQAVTEWGIVAYIVGIAVFLGGFALVVWFVRRSEWRPWNVFTGRR